LTSFRNNFLLDIVDKEDNIIVPAPPISLKDEHLEEYVRLYKGLRDREDPVTWRTFITTSKLLLGSSDPDNAKLSKNKFRNAKRLINLLAKETYLQNLKNEIYYAMGFGEPKVPSKKCLDVLLLNGRHKTEPLFWSLADELKKRRKRIAVVNPVGHYNDWQSRILAPGKIFCGVKKLIILASTQEIYGGNIAVLANVIRIIRNPELSRKIEEADVVIPMFGGSRGHRIGQTEEIGFEVLEAIFNAKILALATKDALEHLKKDNNGQVPKVRFFSVDIHDTKYPAKVFKEQSFEFISISPAKSFANSAYKLLKGESLLKTPVKLVACDHGAVTRTEKFAEELLYHPKNGIKSVEIIYIKKLRKKAGKITDAFIEKISEWKLKEGKLVKQKLRIKKKDFSEHVLFYSDDMIDTGGTAAKDIELLSTYYPNSKLKIFCATHPVLSKGPAALERIGVDVYLLGNTLNPEGLWESPGVYMVNMASAIAKEFF
jgi:phosphoribosylpyrophosphate synthetase